MQNDVFERKSYIPLDDDLTVDDIADIIKESFYCDLYSYFVGRKDNLIVIKTVVSSTPSFNTIDHDTAFENVLEKIVDYITRLSDDKCICFDQPPIELMIELYQPMIRKMSKRIQSNWRHYEYDDLVAIGNFCMVKLHQKGYYINKWLLWTAFNNEILCECRDLKHKPIIVSLYDKTKSDIKLDSNDITYADMIEDEDYKIEKEQEDEQQLEKYIFEQVKSIIIERIGPRQWDQLYRDYSKCHTDGTNSRSTMKRMRDYLKSLGLTRQDFINMYRR